jgi:uncharacterized LabA/DUF88 family protein
LRAMLRDDLQQVIPGIQRSADTPLQIRLYVSERFVGNATAWDVNGQAVEIVASGKDTDVALALHVAQPPLSIMTIILLSGGADLVPLVQQAKDKGRKTLVVASRPQPRCV